jgi:LysR family transcriptional regulator, low CO2-responsive transcriptional regulator
MRTALRRYFRHGLFPQLMVFEAVARLGSVTRAAEELHLAQPTVSTQLRKLTDSLGVTLLEWNGREMRLTAAGGELHASCAELLLLFGGIEGRLAAHREPRPPRPEALRLAAVPGARQLAARLLAAFCESNPGVPASLHVAEGSELLERREAGEDHFYLLSAVEAAAPMAERFLRDALKSGRTGGG